MTQAKHPGALMRAEIAEAKALFAARAAADHRAELAPLALDQARAVITIARGSSDAAANVLSYEMMRVLGRPVTSLPPSVFSIGAGVAMEGMAALILSQSGGSSDLAAAARGIRARGGRVMALTNVPGSPVEAAADLTLPIGAGEELAVPATKSVTCTLAAGMALLAALEPGYAASRDAALAGLAQAGTAHPRAAAVQAALLRASNVFIIGRDCGYGAAQELALKIKETSAIHAEAYSASEVLHGPLQLATRQLAAILLDIGTPQTAESMDLAERRLREAGAQVIRLKPADVGAEGLTPVAAAALLLMLAYPMVLEVALALGHDPDSPSTLAKVTLTT